MPPDDSGDQLSVDGEATSFPRDDHGDQFSLIWLFDIGRSLFVLIFFHDFP
jgi:hypothetical protein